MSELSYKPWLNENDSDEVLFSSIHLYGGARFYPCSGKELDNTPPIVESESFSDDKKESDSERKGHIINIELSPIGPGPWDIKARQRLSALQRQELCTQASLEFRHKVLFACFILFSFT